MAKAVYFIGLQNGQNFLFDKAPQEISKRPSKAIIGARLAYDDILSHGFKLEKDLTGNELLVTTEIKMYEETGLDIEKSYRIGQVKKEKYTGYEHLYEGFAIDRAAFFEKYAQPLKKIKHIDFLAIPYLAFSTLYRRKMLEGRQDLFVYISENEAFTAFYKDGSYISSKKAKTLGEMVAELDARNIQTDTEALKLILLEKGLVKANYSLDEYDIYDYLLQTFIQFFTKINNLAMHNRNIYGFSEIERIYFSLDNRLIPGLEEAMENFFTKPSLHDFGFYPDTPFDALDIMAASYIQDLSETPELAVNLTFFEKREALYRTETGKLLLSTIAAALLIGAYPAWQAYEIYRMEQQKSELTLKEQELSRASKKLQQRYKKLKKEIAAVEKEKKGVDQKLQNLKEVAQTLLSLKSNDKKYTTMLLKITGLLQKYRLSVEKIRQTGEQQLDLELSSKENRRDTIALFMQDLLAAGYAHVSANEIALAEGRYKSVVTVKR
ncbi:MAG: hypothetical protein B6D59_01150 [Campylobacteraceae bacterium 4484_4]|nr:MAG: hypothetical protein B6D59_01150 [Campylobacteraceae bacterium 4484_4]